MGSRPEYQIKYYHANKDSINERRREKYAKATNWQERRDKRRESNKKQSIKVKSSYVEIVTALKDNPCMDCGNKFPTECMDFDHVRGEKLFGIGQSSFRSIDSLLTEIDKCDLVCSNCHRIRTKKRIHMKLAEKQNVV